MLDYIVSKIEASGEKAEPRKREIIKGSGIKTNYILIGPNKDERTGIVLLVDQVFPNDSFNRIYGVAKKTIPDVAAAVYKDGKKFFRSAAAGEENTGIQSKRHKLRNDRSLKDYTDEDLRKMISFRPEEEFLRTAKNGVVQYYQPASDRLEEGIVSYKFEPVVFDYSHLDSGARFGPVEQDSERLRIWKQSGLNMGAIFVEDGLLKAKKKA